MVNQKKIDFPLKKCFFYKNVTIAFLTNNHFQNLSNDSKPKIHPLGEFNGLSENSETKIDIKEETYSSSQEDLKRTTNDTILKRIPVGAEATTVLVSFNADLFLFHIKYKSMYLIE